MKVGKVRMDACLQGGDEFTNPVCDHTSSSKARLQHHSVTCLERIQGFVYDTSTPSRYTLGLQQQQSGIQTSLLAARGYTAICHVTSPVQHTLSTDLNKDELSWSRTPSITSPVADGCRSSENCTAAACRASRSITDPEAST